RHDSGIRVSVHPGDAAAGLYVWHFVPLLHGAGRGLDSLGVPILTRDGDHLRPNAAARHLLGTGPEAEPAMRAAVTGARALPVPSRDGLTDVLLLPGHPTPRDGLPH